MLTMRWGRAGLGVVARRCGSGLDMGEPFWVARLDAVPGSIGVPFSTRRRDRQQGIHARCLSPSPNPDEMDDAQAQT